MNSEKLLYLSTSLVSPFINLLKSPPAEANSILVVKLDEIGDMIYTLHCIEALSKRYEHAQITVYCKPMNNMLVEQTGVVHKIVNTFDELDAPYDIQIDFRGDWETLAFALKGGCRYYLERGSVRLANKLAGAQTHEVTTNNNILAPFFNGQPDLVPSALHISDADLTFVKALLAEHGVNDNFVLMHCGARDESRRWPANKFTQLTDQIFEKYGIKSVYIGSPAESDLVKSISDSTPNAINLAGKTNLMQLAALCRLSTFFVGNESGPMHFAVIEQKSLIALFGPGVKDVFYPLYPNQHVIHHFKEKDHTNQTSENSTIHLIEVEDVMAIVGEIM